jgi:hypothetical protein
MNPQAAADVCNNWPTEIWFSTHDIGKTVITGDNWDCPAGTNPVCDAYLLFSPNGRMSWDLTAVWAAIMGVDPFFFVSDPGRFIIDEIGANDWKPLLVGKHRYLIKKAADEMIAKVLTAYYNQV